MSKETYIEVHLKPNSPEYMEIESTFRSSADRYNKRVVIESVIRVQNRPLFLLYQAAAKVMKADYAGTRLETRIEKQLWHGTSSDTVLDITRHGFNRSYCGKNAVAYGNGVYFAVASQYSCQSKYASPDSSGLCHIILADVLIGEYAQGCPRLKEPPEKRPKIGFAASDRYVGLLVWAYKNLCLGAQRQSFHPAMQAIFRCLNHACAYAP